jgi:ferrous iron transport protein B
MARARGLVIDSAKLAAELGCPVVETVAVRSDGHAALLTQLARWTLPAGTPEVTLPPEQPAGAAELQQEVRRILAIAAPLAATRQRLQVRIDVWVLHPLWGLAILAALLFVTFQAVFSWANWPMDAIRNAMALLGDATTAWMAPGPLRSLVVDGAIAGAGSVLVFLPQILILFAFILALEDSGYLPRAAFLLDNLMGKVGLSGRAFIPLLSSWPPAASPIGATASPPS